MAQLGHTRRRGVRAHGGRRLDLRVGCRSRARPTLKPMSDAMYFYTCPRCGSEAVVIGALDPASITCDRCSPKHLTLVEPSVTDNGEAS